MQNKNLVVLILALVFTAGIFYFSNGGEEEISPTERQESIPPKIGKKTVFVSGQVKNPAVVSLEDEENLTLADAVNAVGGVTEFADLEQVNLAEPLIDGQHIHIPTKEILLAPEVEQSEKFSSQTVIKNSSGEELVNINTADLKKLETLPGVGPAIAQRIIDYREQSGLFKSIEELKKVRGIGEKRFEKLKDSIKV